MRKKCCGHQPDSAGFGKEIARSFAKIVRYVGVMIADIELDRGPTLNKPKPLGTICLQS